MVDKVVQHGQFHLFSNKGVDLSLDNWINLYLFIGFNRNKRTGENIFTGTCGRLFSRDRKSRNFARIYFSNFFNCF